MNTTTDIIPINFALKIKGSIHKFRLVMPISIVSHLKGTSQQFGWNIGMYVSFVIKAMLERPEKLWEYQQQIDIHASLTEPQQAILFCIKTELLNSLYEQVNQKDGMSSKKPTNSRRGFKYCLLSLYCDNKKTFLRNINATT